MLKHKIDFILTDGKIEPKFLQNLKNDRVKLYEI